MYSVYSLNLNPLPFYSRQRLQSPCSRALLALEGGSLTHELLRVALPCCRRLTDRVDILVTKPPKAPTFLLGGLLTQLERFGVDYRLTSVEGELDAEVTHYLRRFPSISVVVVDSLAKWERTQAAALTRLRRDGYRLVSLLDNPARTDEMRDLRGA